MDADFLYREQNRIEAVGNVVATGKGMTLKADRLVYNTDTSEIIATGSCTFTDEMSTIQASSISYNANSGDIVIHEGVLTSAQGPMRITGETISRTGEDHIQASRAYFTPCTGDPPDWSLYVEDLDIPLGGYGQGRDVRFTIRGTTVFRTPWLFFPAKFYRHSGVLLPEISHGSDYGYRFGLPLYLVVSPSLDATFTPTYLSERGMLSKVELRYSPWQDTTGLIYLETLRDRLGGEVAKTGVEPVVPEGRWFLTSRQTGSSVRWDVNLTSTPDYFRDIGVFLNDNPLQEDDPAPQLNHLGDSRLEDLVSRAQWSGSIKPFTWSVATIYRQDLTTADNGSTVQQEPRAAVRISSLGIPSTPILVSSEMGVLRAASDDWVDAVKRYGVLHASMPVGISPYFTLTPAISEFHRDTRLLDRAGTSWDPSYAERWQERTVALSTTLYSPLLPGGIRHQVVPSIAWRYLARHGDNAEEGDDDRSYPVILPEDRMQKENNVEARLHNYLRNASGASLVDLSVKALYSLHEGAWKEASMEAACAALEHANISYENVWTRSAAGTYSTKEQTVKATVSDSRGDALSFGYDYYRQETDLLRASIDVTLGRGCVLSVSAEYDRREDRLEETRQEFTYTSQCWEVSVARKTDASDEDEPSRTVWSVNVRLLGIGDIPQTRSPSS